jgi:O-antigen/teichoic acid export membrane protein
VTSPNAINAPAPATSVSRRLLQSSGRVALYQGIGLLLAFGLQTLISRTCGPAAVGVYTLFSTWLIILSVLTVPGLESCLVFFLPRLEQDYRSQRIVARTCLLATAALSLLCGGILAGLGSRPLQWIGLPSAARLAFAFSIVFFSIGKLLDAVFLARKDAPLTSYYNIVRLGLRVLFCLPVLVYPGAAWTIIFLAIAVESALTAAFRFFRIQKRYDGLMSFDRTDAAGSSVTAKTIARTSLPMLGINLIDTVSPVLDKAIMGLMIPLTLIGVYRISEYVGSLNSLFVAPFVAFWPFISSLSSQKRLDELGLAYKNITLIIFALMFPFSLALFELSSFVLALFGPVFAQQGTAVFIILAIGTIVDAIAGPAGAVLRLAGHYRLSLLINLFLLISYCAATFLLARHYGIVGAALARTAILILGNLINVAANRTFLHVFPYTSKHALLLAAAAGILVLRYSLLPHHPSSIAHLVIAFAQVAAFGICAWFILRAQVRQAPGYLKAMVSVQV